MRQEIKGVLDETLSGDWLAFEGAYDVLERSGDQIEIGTHSSSA